MQYAITNEARQVFARALGSLDPKAMPSLPSFPGVHYVPIKGDLLRWSEIGEEHTFVVIDRYFRVKGPGALEIVLAVDLFIDQP